MLIIEYSPKFSRLYKKLPLLAKRRSLEREQLFRQNPFDPRLETHKLSGRLENYWAFSIDQKYRIIFSFAAKNRVRSHAIGDHSICQ